MYHEIIIIVNHTVLHHIVSYSVIPNLSLNVGLKVETECCHLSDEQSLIRPLNVLKQFKGCYNAFKSSSKNLFWRI